MEYAIDGTIATCHRLEFPHDRWGCDPAESLRLAAKVTGVSFTAGMLDQPLLIGPVACRWSPPGHTTA
ncbi:hypothetical protein AW168_01920 [Nocardia brasiliensis]|uniref:Uncharacterized protein n=1 Tax=Nocardia brasiliensis (strain ATCC 700358 / HUJEG-1) TaxID=1133849 RepID=K0ET20_NOCB7|nr:hypothetical protein O3I_013330 [Nocardia brasiliensis ATCC 700358]OCF83902.1 hypothetical protein AW168_01920 [Nocardia brasiliensis]